VCFLPAVFICGPVRKKTRGMYTATRPGAMIRKMRDFNKIMSGEFPIINLEPRVRFPDSLVGAATLFGCGSS